MSADIHNRVKEIIEYMGVSERKFAQEMGVPATNLYNSRKRGSDLPSSLLCTIVTRVEGLNADWLLTGRGEMLHGSEQKQDEADGESVAVVMRYLQEQLRREDARREQIMQHYQTELEQTRKHYKEELDQAHKHFQEELKYYQSLYELSKRVMEMGERLNGVEAQLELKEQKRG